MGYFQKQLRRGTFREVVSDYNIVCFLITESYRAYYYNNTKIKYVNYSLIKLYAYFLFIFVIHTADYPSVSVDICYSLFSRWCRLSLSLATGLRKFDTRRRFITSIDTAAVNDERRRSAHLFLVKVQAHHSAPSSAALAEGSRADCIQTISPRVQVSTRVGPHAGP